MMMMMMMMMTIAILIHSFNIPISSFQFKPPLELSFSGNSYEEKCRRFADAGVIPLILQALETPMLIKQACWVIFNMATRLVSLHPLSTHPPITHPLTKHSLLQAIPMIHVILTP